MSLKYPIGIETFEEIIEGGYSYVDKTEVIYRLIQSGKYFFLNRPRRFGKSLMLSTIEAYCKGRKELFEGLWLGQAEGVDWTPRPALRLNFGNIKPTIEDLNNNIDAQLLELERMYEITSDYNNFAWRFSKIIERAKQSTGQRVVILIDDYNKILANTKTNPELYEKIDSIIKPMFCVLKKDDQHIQFAILTGVSHFSKLSIFSDINNLCNISFDDRYSTICGITEEELKTSFKDGVQDFADAHSISFDGALQMLKDNYDGYHFSQRCPDIYNPFSLINALHARKIRHRWFESGTPSFLFKKVRNTDENLRDMLTPEVSANLLSNTSISDTNLISMLYQTGYLTIKSYDVEEDSFQLGIPNHEVEFGLYSGLLPLYTGKNESANDTLLLKLRRALRANEIDRFMEALKSYLAGVPYGLSNGKPEIYYENNLFLIFKMLGFKAQVEQQTSQGRIDVTLQTATHIYVIELKLDGTAEEALRQIEKRNYALPFEIDGREIVRIGVNFSSQTRTIEDWLIEK